MILQKEYYPSADREIEYNPEIDPNLQLSPDTNEISTSKPGKMNMLVKFGGTCQLQDILIMNPYDNAYHAEHTGVDYSGASVDIYEWTKLRVASANYSGSGTVKSNN